MMTKPVRARTRSASPKPSADAGRRLGDLACCPILGMV